MRHWLHRSHAIIAGVILLGFTAVVRSVDGGENWPGWRGPTGSGTTDEKDLPLTWEGKKGENILWKVPLTGAAGYSSPIVWADKIIVTGADKPTRQQEEKKEVPGHHLCCFSVADGRLLWRTDIEPGKEAAGSTMYAVPTPVTDGTAVYAWFGSGVIAAVDMDGKRLWRQEKPGPYILNPGLCSSPVLFGDTVLLLCEQGREKGWLQALDKKTGNIIWEQKRGKTSYANTTPILASVGGRTEMIVSASNAVQGLDPATGDVIWSCKAQGFGSSPVFGSGFVYNDAGNGGSAVVVDPSGAGDVTSTNVKWTVPKVPSQYASAVIAGDYVYRASDHGVITCWRLATGEQMFAQQVDGVSKLSSPIASADGRIYFANGEKTFVLKAGPTYELLAMNDLKGGDNASSAAVAGGRIFIRGNDFLYAIGKH